MHRKETRKASDRRSKSCKKTVYPAKIIACSARTTEPIILSTRPLAVAVTRFHPLSEPHPATTEDDRASLLSHPARRLRP